MKPQYHGLKIPLYVSIIKPYRRHGRDVNTKLGVTADTEQSSFRER